MKRIYKHLALLLLLFLITGQLWAQNTVASSTMIFQGTLTDNGDGTYTGVVPMIDYIGFDIYALEAGTAWFGNDPGTGPVWTSQAITGHDAWPTWNPDTPDWYQYSISFYQDGGQQKWALRNHPGATAANPWSTNPTLYPPMGVPMSGTMNWTNTYAAETDIGSYLPGTGTPEIPGGAASKGAGAGYWDMDWSWGSEAVPLEYPGFNVDIELNAGVYTVTLTPAIGPFVNLATGNSYATLQDAIDAANPSEVIEIDAGIWVYGSTINLNKAITIQGLPTEALTKIQTSGSSPLFSITADNVTLQDLEIEKTDKVSQNIIYVGGNNFTFTNCEIYGQFVIGDGQVERGFEIAAVTGLNINNSIIHNLRQPAYINDASGNITDNMTFVTKGWVIITESNLSFTGNSWGTGANVNYYDIAIVKNSPEGANNYPDIVTISDNNNDAIIENQHSTYSPAILSIVHVDANTSATGLNGSILDPYSTIAPAIPRVATGGKILVAAGTYAGNILVNKSLSIIGDPGDSNPGPGLNASIINGGSTIGSAFFIDNGVSNVDIKGFEMCNYINGSGNGEGNGISAWEASTSYITVEDNYFHDLEWNCVLVGNDGALGDHTNWLIANNIAENIGYIAFELTNTSNSTIEDNIIHLNTPVIGAIFSSARRSETGLTVMNNIIDGTPSTLYPVIYMYAYDNDMPNPNLNNVLIEGNDIQTSGTPFQVYLRNIGTGTVTNVTVYHNKISTLKNLTAMSIDAENNYWGSIYPIDFISKISGDVDFDPWCNNDFSNCNYSKSNGPVTYAGKVVATGSAVTVPITVENFDNVDAVSLTLVYNPSVITYTGFDENTVLSAYADMEGNATGGKVILGWNGNVGTGVSLPDDAVLVNIYFSVIGGTSLLTWFDDDGINCEYQNALIQYPYTDIPTPDFYKNGWVTDLSVTFTRTYSPETITAVVAGGTGTYAYSWTGPGGFTAGNVATITPTNGYGNYVVTITDGLGAMLVGTYYYGPVHNVNTYFDYATIQEAIDAVITVDGHTLVADASTYNEQVVINKGVTIIGDVANPDNVIIDGENKTTLTLDGQVRIYNPTGIVTFKGFKIINGGKKNSSEYFAVLTKGSYSITVQNCKFIGHGSSVDIGSDYAFWAYGASGSLDIKNCYFTDMYHGILLERQWGACTIENNTFDALFTGLYSGSQYGGRAIEAINYSDADITSLQRITGNSFINFKSTGVLFSGGFSGQVPKKFTNVEIDNNDFNFITTDIVNSFGAINLRNVSIGNSDPNGGVTANIHNNKINLPNSSGIQISGLNGTITCHDNSILGLPYGMKADEALTTVIDATCNWWGTSTVSGVDAAIIGPVAYDPWLIDGTDVGDPGFVPGGTCTGATDLYVNDGTFDGNDIYTTAIGNDANPGTDLLPFLTITKAVNTAVDGTNIWVDAGTFQEQVNIGKTLNLTGNDRTKTIVKAPVTMSVVSTANGNVYPIIYASGIGNTINVEKITIDGDGGRTNNKFEGIHYFEASGTFNLNKITGIRNTTFNGADDVGFVANHTWDAPVSHTVTVTNNIIDDYGKGGIVINELNTHGIVTGNVVSGQNIPNVNGQNGIQFGFGSYGTITGNTVTNNIWNAIEHPHVWTAAGILIIGVGVNNSNTPTGNLTVVGINNLNGNEVGLSVVGDDTYGYSSNAGLTVNANTFANNKIHSWLADPATIPPVADTYDKRVDNTAMTNAVFGCIQYAVDEASSGNTLNASSGTFVENVSVHTPVTINGNGMANTIVMPSFSAPNPGGGGSLPAGSSNIFLVQANGVIIQNLTVEGNNPSLTSGVFSNGVDVDARNGIITDHTTGSWTNLTADNVKIQNIYLRGFYSSTGGYFVIKNSTVINVEGESQSLGIMNWAGTGLIQNNNVSQADINSNHSKGVIYEYNTVTNSGGGIHTDNNGSMGGIADIIRYNNVSSGTPSAYGIWVFASYLNTQVYENTVSGVSVGLCASGQYGGMPSFTGNTVTGNQFGISTTTSLFGWGSSNCTAMFTNNFIDNNTVEGIDCEAEDGYTNTTTVNDNHIAGNTVGVVTTGIGTFSLDMECNWWGSADGDVIASLVPATVDYIPWLSDGSDAGNPGFVPGGYCTGAPDMTGTYKYYNSGLTALTNIDVELWKGGSKVYPASGTVTTDGTGTYTFTNVLPDTYEVRASTLKAVGGINSTDAAQVNYWGVTPTTIEKVRWLSGDVNNNGSVVAADAGQIQQYFLTQGNPTPAFASNWSFWKVNDLILANPDFVDYPLVFVPNVGTTVSQNFYGLVTGDFNRSFTPSALKSGSESLTLNYGQTVEVGDAEFELPLVAATDMQVGAISLILSFPSDVLTVNDVFMSNDQNTPVLFNVTGDELRISWYSPESLSLQAGERLVTLVLEATGSSSEPIYFSLASDPLNELADATFEVIGDAAITVDVIKTTALGTGENLLSNNLLFGNYPNPFIGTTNFVYTIPTDGKVLIEVYDIVGNKVMDAVNETQSAGEYLLKLDRNNLQPGVYTATLKLENNGSVISRTIKIISK